MVVTSLLPSWLSVVPTTHLSDNLFLFFLELQDSQRQLERARLPRWAQGRSGRERVTPFTQTTAGGLSLRLAVSIEKKQNQFLGTTKQWESFQRYPKVAQLQDPSRLVLWKALDVNSKPFEKCHFKFMKISGEENIESGNCSGWKWHFQEWLIWIYSHAKWSRVHSVYSKMLACFISRVCFSLRKKDYGREGEWNVSRETW